VKAGGFDSFASGPASYTAPSSSRNSSRVVSATGISRPEKPTARHREKRIASVQDEAQLVVVTKRARNRSLAHARTSKRLYRSLQVARSVPAALSFTIRRGIVIRQDTRAVPWTAIYYTGFEFWLTKLNQFNGDYVAAEMVKASISSAEYRQRFGP